MLSGGRSRLNYAKVVSTLCLGATAFLAMLALAEGVAVAHKAAFNSQVTIRWIEYPLAYGGTFAGRVTSANPGCGAGRTIRVFRVVRDSSDPEVRVLKWVTNVSGGWTALTRTGSGSFTGTYYARVLPKDLTPRSAAHDHICRGDRSPNLEVKDIAR